MDNFLAKDGEFVVFGDPKQNLYQRPIDANGDIALGVIPGVWNHQLKDGRRFSNPQLVHLATEFQKRFFDNNFIDKFENDIEIQNSLFTKIKYVNLRTCDCQQIVDTLIDVIKDFDNQDLIIMSQSRGFLRDLDYQYRKQTNLQTQATFIDYETYDKLNNITNNIDKEQAKDSLEKKLKLDFSMNSQSLKFSTINSFKGWEATSVVLFIEQNEHSSPELIYTGLTRAKENLVIINLGDNLYDDFFRNYINS